MSAPNPAVIGLETSRKFFKATAEVLTDEDSDFRPVEGMFTTAHVIGHTAQTVEWFVDAVFTDKGFDMNFEGAHEALEAVKTVSEALAWLDRAHDRAVAEFGKLSPEQLHATIPDNPIMGPVPKIAVVSAMTDHTAHHRGALAVYARLRGKTPKMPYAED